MTAILKALYLIFIFSNLESKFVLFFLYIVKPDICHRNYFSKAFYSIVNRHASCWFLHYCVSNWLHKVVAHVLSHSSKRLGCQKCIKEV